MPVAICRVGELEWDVALIVSAVHLRASFEQLRRQLAADQAGQELAQDHVLVVPRRRVPRLFEQLTLGDPVLAEPVDEPVVQADECNLKLAHEQVNVVAWIAEEGDSLLVARHVRTGGPEQQLGGIVLGVQIRRANRPSPVEPLEVRLGRAKVADLRWVGAMPQRRAIGGDVVCDELAEQRPHRRRRGILVIGEVNADVAGSSCSPERVQRLLVDVQRREVLEHAAIAAAIDRRIDPLGRQAVISSKTNGMGVAGHVSLLAGLLRASPA
jgi:hypothetical protein